MPDLEIKVDSKQLERAMKQAPFRLFNRLQDRVTKHHRRFLGKFRRERFRGDDAVQSRSKRLGQSFRVEHGGKDLDSLYARTFSSGVPYALIHELGGEITPTKKKWLTIPLDAAKTASGIMRASAMHWPDTFFMTSKKGNLLIMQDRGDADPLPLFLLVRSVRLKPRLGFLDTWRKTEGDLFKEIDLAAKEALEPQAAGRARKG